MVIFRDVTRKVNSSEPIINQESNKVTLMPYNLSTLVFAFEFQIYFHHVLLRFIKFLNILNLLFVPSEENRTLILDKRTLSLAKEQQ